VAQNLHAHAVNDSPAGGEIIVHIENIDDEVGAWVSDHGRGSPGEAARFALPFRVAWRRHNQRRIT
jgi:signal transduction histidine kinase